MKSYRITQARVVNEGQISEMELLIRDGFIIKIGTDLSGEKADVVLDAQGKYLLPGLIDDQVHFREPGLTHKATIGSEARAAVAGGVTSFMEMPNTVPQAVTNELLEEKYAIAARTSLANYSFFLGATNNNLEELLKLDKQRICGVKIFMGSSTGNMLVDDLPILERIFAEVDSLIATHCEKDPMIKANEQIWKARFGESVPLAEHPNIRSREACYASSSEAVALAKKHGTRLHILHISTAEETALFENNLPLAKKRITAEACIHHLWFSDADYAEKGTLIKWNPAVKTANDRASIRQAVLDGRIDVIATDHAPHTQEEKNQQYFKAPSGGPLVQHALQALYDMHHQGFLSVPQIVEKACHNPATLFRIDRRGFIREGYWADLVLFDPQVIQQVSKANIHYHCGWSPFEGHTFKGSVSHTFVSGHLAYEQGQFHDAVLGKRLKFS